jgi:hypothetical protein
VSSDAASQRSSAPLLGALGGKETVASKAKQFFQKLKEENEERKKSSVQHVTKDQATAITGHGEGGARSNSKEGKGDGRVVAAFSLF